MTSKKIFSLFLLGIFLILAGLAPLRTRDEKKTVINFQTFHTVAVLSPSPISTSSASSSNLIQSDKREEVFVERVVDGDTIQVSINNTKETVRLIGIDTPETADPRKPVQCFGREASDFTKSLLAGKTVFLEDDPTQGNRDKYQRLLRYVLLADGTNVNKFIIEQGYAHEYTYHIPYKYQSEFRQAEKDARENNRGLWSACSS